MYVTEDDANIYQPLFHDRFEAGARLAARLAGYKGKGALVLGIPRGGVPVAAEVAERLNADLDVVVARKLGSPVSSELAVGAVTADGNRYLNERIMRELQISEAYLRRVTAEQTEEARHREARFRGGHAESQIRNRIVIVVDDGLATGATMIAALRSVRARAPAKLVVAVPVGPPATCTALQHEADEVVCLYQPWYFRAVGLHYEHFEPTEDEDVQRILEEFRAWRRQTVERVG